MMNALKVYKPAWYYTKLAGMGGTGSKEFLNVTRAELKAAGRALQDQTFVCQTSYKNFRCCNIKLMNM